MFVNNKTHSQVIKECVSLSISNNVVGKDLKLHTHLGFDGLTCTHVIIEMGYESLHICVCVCVCVCECVCVCVEYSTCECEYIQYM